MITDDDVVKIRKALKPDFDRLDQKIDQSEKNVKQYIHEGVDAVVNGVDDLLQEYQFDPRIKKLEKIHPGGSHPQID